MNKKVHLVKGFDRISSLPEPIRAHILSFLPTRKAVRMSILSTSWRALWTQMSSLDLRYFNLPILSASRKTKTKTSITKNKRLLYYDFIDLAFQSLMMLEKVKLYVPHFGSRLKPRVDNWVARAFGYPLTEFDLHLEYLSDKASRYYLPKIVFGSNLITKLELRNCGINESCLSDIHLPSLCNLSLACVSINEEAMGILVANCPNLENFKFDYCDGLKRLEISGHAKLKKMEIAQYDQYHYDPLFSISIDCINMKVFKAIGAPICDSELHSLLENLPALERLEFHQCNKLRNIEISSPHLVHLEFVKCENLRKAKVNAPNLKYLKYFYHRGVYYPVRFPLIALTSRLKEAIISLSPCQKQDNWQQGLVKFLAKLSHCERLTLIISRKKDLTIPQELRNNIRPPLFGVKHLVVQLCKLGSVPVKKRISVDFVEALLWLAPCPQTISICSQKSFEFKYESLLKRRKKCDCWKSLPVNCWRHSLSKVSVENKYESKDDVELSNFFRNARFDGKLIEYSFKDSISKKNQS
ncbi:uncharacterized protein LOC141595802 [Silene latifolia]|uniref:uncharacterized protein LOC141595802 n=1 Tax=Silene latifolia TaxID=37657 RepID=UPI003D785FBB